MSGIYHGRPMEKHLPLPVDFRHFDRWLTLFEETAHGRILKKGQFRFADHDGLMPIAYLISVVRPFLMICHYPMGIPWTLSAAAHLALILTLRPVVSMALP